MKRRAYSQMGMNSCGGVWGQSHRADQGWKVCMSLSQYEGAGKGKAVCLASSCPKGDRLLWGVDHAVGDLWQLHPRQPALFNWSRLPQAQPHMKRMQNCFVCTLKRLHCLIFLTHTAIYLIVYTKDSLWLLIWTPAI